MVEINYSKKIQREELSKIIGTISKILKDGKGIINLDGYSMSLEIADEVNIELEFEINKVTEKLEIEIKWAKEETEVKKREVMEEVSESEQVIEYDSEAAEPEKSIEESIESITEVKPEADEIEQKEEVPISGAISNEVQEVEMESDKRMEEILKQLTEQMHEIQTPGSKPTDVSNEVIEAEKSNNEDDFKPHGNIFEITEEINKDETKDISPDEEELTLTNEPESDIPIYEPSSETADTEKPVEDQETKDSDKTEEEEDIGSTDDLQKILEALKKSNLNEE